MEMEGEFRQKKINGIHRKELKKWQHARAWLLLQKQGTKPPRSRGLLRHHERGPLAPALLPRCPRFEFRISAQDPRAADRDL